MTEHLLSPDRSVEITGTTYKLSGSLPTLRSIQEHFKRDILNVLADSLQLKLWFTDLAVILRFGIECGGQTPPSLDVIEQAIVDDIGINQAGYIVMEWLAAATSPKKEREGNVNGVLAGIKAIEAMRKAPRKK